MSAEPASIDYARNGAVGWLRLNRPDRLNALSAAMRDAFAETLAAVAADPPHVLVITGNGRGFCTGQDLSERRAMIERGETPDLGASLDQSYNPLIRRIATLPCLTIAAVNGVAAGAGLGIALSADLIVAARSARFIPAFDKVGLIPDAGTSWGLPERIGRGRALATLLTGTPIDAAQALDWGLVSSVFEDDAFVAQVDALAQSLALGSIAAQLATRDLIRSPAATLNDQLDCERDRQQELGRTDFFKASVLNRGAGTTRPAKS